MENAEELKNQREQPDLDKIRKPVSPPPETEATGDLWEFPVIWQLWNNQIIMDETAG